MALFAQTFDSLNDLFLFELKDLYDAEHQITEALPKMAAAATDPRLKTAFNNHLMETQGHISRLEQVFREIGAEPERETCAAMKGLVSEGSDMVKADGADSVRDAGLIAAAQRVEHYEMAGYGTVRTLARQLGFNSAAQTLQATLDEEGKADELLSQIAQSSVNPRAASTAHA